jgi:hypothetical protein
MVRYKRLTMPFKIIAIYLLYNFLDVAANNYSIAVFNNNFILLHTETFINFISFSITYYLLFRNVLIRRIILIVIPVYTIFSFINSFVIQPYSIAFPSFAMMVSEVLFILYALLLFKQMLLYPLQLKITEQSVFWFNLAILFFSTLMFLNFALVNYYLRHNIRSHLLTNFWHFIDIILNILLGIAILTDNKERSTTNA